MTCPDNEVAPAAVNAELVSLQMLFLSFDTDRSGKMSSYELRIALKAAGAERFVSLLFSFTHFISFEGLRLWGRGHGRGYEWSLGGAKVAIHRFPISSRENLKVT